MVEGSSVVRKHFFLSLWVLCITAQSSLVFSDCSDVLSRVDSFSNWSLEESNLRLKARDLFPEEYLRQVESQLGPWDIQVIHRPQRGFVQIVGTVRSRPYVRVKLIQDPRDRKSLIVDELNLQDPLQKAEPSQLNPDQMGKGLPAASHARTKGNAADVLLISVNAKQSTPCRTASSTNCCGEKIP